MMNGLIQDWGEGNHHILLDSQLIGPVDGFASVPDVRGKGPSRRLEFRNVGLTGIDFLPLDRAAWKVRGTRYARVRDLGIQGHAPRYGLDENGDVKPIGEPGVTPLPMTDERYWGDDNQHAVMEINDRTAGTEDPASDNGLCNVWFGGFQNGLLIGQDIETNGDFSFGEHWNFEDVKNVICAMNHQGRTVTLRRAIGARFWTLLTNIDPTGSHGQIGGTMDAISCAGFAGHLGILAIGGVLGPLTFIAPKFEKLWRMFTITGATSTEGNIPIYGGNLNFAHRPEHKFGMPANIVSGNSRATIKCDAVTFAGTNFLSMLPPNCRLEGGANLTSLIDPQTPVERTAWNASAGIFCGTGHQHDARVSLYTPAGTEVSNVPTTPGEFKEGNVAVPFWVRSGRFPGHREGWTQRRPDMKRPVSNFTPAADENGDPLSSGRKVVWDAPFFAAMPQWQRIQYGLAPGGQLRHRETGAVIWIYSVDGHRITGRIMSGYDYVHDDDGNLIDEVPIDILGQGGSFDVIGSGYKVTERPLRGTFSPGSHVITDVIGDTDGLSIGDTLATLQHPFKSDNSLPPAQRHPFGDYPTIAAINEDSIELAGPVNISATGLDLSIWVSPAPANEDVP